MPNKAQGKKDAGVLMSLAVLPGEQGKGIGQSLVAAFLKEASQRGLKQIFLTTDREGNDTVNRFYKSLGFSNVGSYITPEGRGMNKYMINLGTDSTL